jgi:hypothetical protein
MPAALEILTGTATAPGAVLTGLTMNPTDSNQIRSAAFGKPISLIGAWAFNNAAGTLDIRSPRLHDNVQGIRLNVVALDPDPLYPSPDGYGWAQPLVPQDTLTLQLSGSAVGGQVEVASILVYYQDLPSIAGRFIDWPTVQKNGVNMMGQETTCVTGGAAGYSGTQAINAQFDNWKANTDYALIGYNVSTDQATVGWRGIDVGNLRVGGPCTKARRHITSSWFAGLSMAYGIPLIPVFNSQNKNAIIVDIAGNQAAANVIVTSLFIEMKPGSVPGSPNPGQS